jgi:hypothetical protein
MAKTIAKKVTTAPFEVIKRITRKEAQAIKVGTWIVLRKYQRSNVKKSEPRAVLLLERIQHGMAGVVRYYDPVLKGVFNWYDMDDIIKIVGPLEVPVITDKTVKKTPVKKAKASVKQKVATLAITETTPVVSTVTSDTAKDWPFKDATIDNAPKSTTKKSKDKKPEQPLKKKAAIKAAKKIVNKAIKK